MTKSRIQVGAIIVLSLLAISLLLSQRANPDFPPFFALKRIQEKVFLKLKSNAGDRLDYMSSLLDTRLIELQNVVKNKNYDYVLKASLRYSTLAGRITELIVANNMIEQANVTREKFLSHQEIINTLYVAYPKNIPDNEEWKYILDDFNYLGLYLDKLSK